MTQNPIPPAALIPTEIIEQKYQTARRLGWVTLLSLPVLLIGMLAAATLSALQLQRAFPNLPHWIYVIGSSALFIQFVGMNLCLLWLVRKPLRCPVCKGRIVHHGNIARLAKTGRCPHCRTIVTVPHPCDDSPAEARQRRALLRALIYLLIAAIGILIVMYWLKAQGLLPPNRGPVSAMRLLWHDLAFISFYVLIAWAAQRVRAQRPSQDVPLPAPYPTLTVHPKTTRTIKNFRLYLAPDALCFAHTVSGLYTEKGLASYGQGGFIPLPFFRRSVRQKRRREALYATLDPASPDLLKSDPLNFQLPRPTILALDYQPRHLLSIRKRFPFNPASGILTITFRDPKPPLRLGIADNLSKPEIDAILESWLTRSTTPMQENQPL